MHEIFCNAKIIHLAFIKKIVSNVLGICNRFSEYTIKMDRLDVLIPKSYLTLHVLNYYQLLAYVNNS